jgi:hypothetical protein
MTTSAVAAPPHSRGRLFLALGLALAPLAILAYVVQLVSLHRLTSPWYVPIAATLGVLLVVVSLWQRRTIWRILALPFVVLLAVWVWVMLLIEPLPPYTGPVAAGQPFPAFATVRADATPFTQRDLEGDQDNVLVFFRGRW